MVSSIFIFILFWMNFWDFYSFSCYFFFGLETMQQHLIICSFQLSNRSSPKTSAFMLILCSASPVTMPSCLPSQVSAVTQHNTTVLPSSCIAFCNLKSHINCLIDFCVGFLINMALNIGLEHECAEKMFIFVYSIVTASDVSYISNMVLHRNLKITVQKKSCNDPAPHHI